MNVKQLMVTVFLLIAGIAFSQDFEGTLLYQNDFDITEKMKKKGMSKDALLKAMKEDSSFSEQSVITYQNGNYLAEHVGSSSGKLCYRRDSNKIFILLNEDNAYNVIDAAIDPEFKISQKQPLITLLDTNVVVNERNCKIVRVKWKSGYYDYYFSPGYLPVDGKIYSNHIYDGWSSYMAIANAYPVRIVKYAGNFGIITMTLIKAVNRSIDAELFSIPRLVPVEDVPQIVPGQQIMRMKKP